MPRHPTRGFELGDERTPGPLADSSERMRAIARDEAGAAARMAASEHENQCAQTGHVCGLWKAVEDIRREQKAMEINQEGARGELRGAMRAQTRTLALIVGGATVLGVAAQIVVMLLRHGG